jgi:hypothetical protein
MMIGKPSFSVPTRFSRGTSTYNLQDCVENIPLAFTPEFKIFLHVTPFALSGMIRADTPFAPGPPVRTAAIQ